MGACGGLKSGLGARVGAVPGDLRWCLRFAFYGRVSAGLKFRRA